jgi:hypothetical protein
VLNGKTLLIEYLRENIKMRSDVQSLDTPARRRSQEMSGGNTARKFRPSCRECADVESRAQQAWCNERSVVAAGAKQE